MTVSRKIFFVVFWLAAICCGQSISDIVNLIQQGQFDEAQTAVDQLDRTSNKKDCVLFLRGLLANDAVEAVMNYQKLIRLYPDSRYTPKAILRIAQLKYAQGLYKSSLSLFLSIRDNNPKSALIQESHYWAGLCYLAINQQDSAIIHFGRVLTEFPVRDISKLAAKELETLKIQIPETEASDTTEKKQVTKADETPPAVSDPADMPPLEPVSAQNPVIHFAIQIGAFSDRNNALARKNFYTSKGYPVHLRQKTVAGRQLHLVWVGDCPNESDARRLAESLQKKYNANTTLVKELR